MCHIGIELKKTEIRSVYETVKFKFRRYNLLFVVELEMESRKNGCQLLW